MLFTESYIWFFVIDQPMWTSYILNEISNCNEIGLNSDIIIALENVRNTTRYKRFCQYLLPKRYRKTAFFFANQQPPLILDDEDIKKRKRSAQKLTLANITTTNDYTVANLTGKGAPYYLFQIYKTRRDDNRSLTIHPSGKFSSLLPCPSDHMFLRGTDSRYQKLNI